VTDLATADRLLNGSMVQDHMTIARQRAQDERLADGPIQYCRITAVSGRAD